MDINAKCSICQYWFFRPEHRVMGDCLKIAQDELTADVGCVGKIEIDGVTSVVPDGILTGKNFGCVHFKPINTTNQEAEQITNKL